MPSPNQLLIESVCDRSPAVVDLFDGMRPMLESQMLVQFVEIYPGERVVDIGCGNGYLPLFLGWKYPFCQEFIGVEINESRVQEAHYHHEALQARLDFSLPIIRFDVGDILNWCNDTPAFDVAVSNPPFFPARASRPSPDPTRQTARQHETLTPSALFARAQRLLRPNGRFYLVFPSDRIEEIRLAIRENGFTLIREKSHPLIRRRTGGVSLILARKSF